MAEKFDSSDIEEFKECFLLIAREQNLSTPKYHSSVVNVEQLGIAMRSLGFSPTIAELHTYFNRHAKNKTIDFPLFLQVLADHSQVENCKEDIVRAFRHQDPTNSGMVDVSRLRQILTSTGEKFTSKQIDRFFASAHIPSNGKVSYHEVLQYLLSPLSSTPDE